ncbi:kelch repeat and BTB domain-containing protein 8-like [Branchiostoma floridae]|uniref:Kelch repeat and BTB domain-containing protein 8-like n=1 Tax=Branchiostoma floridae TaxID=7739 RepID=A0A9J7LTN1_BRAFL|nr:kelch repeat and BTB domain-containing protein 8-like [Branchiostoma floridae]
MAMNVGCSTCVDLYKFADVFSVDSVRKACLRGIARHFTMVTSSEELCSLSVNQLTEIISHDELDVKEETTVWEAMVRWVQHSREDRRHLLPSILPHIRFNLLTSDDMAAILDHPLVREHLGSSKVIRNVVQKGNPKLKPRLGMTTEMAILYCGSKELLFMNPQDGKYISLRYSREDMPEFSAMTVTSDDDIYILETTVLENENQVSLFKYNHAKNVWEQAGVSSIPQGPVHAFSHCQELLLEVDMNLYYLAVDREIDRPLLQMRKYNHDTNQWQECSSLQFNENLCYSATLSCGSHLYFLTDSDVYCYVSSQDRWSERTPPYIEVCTAVAMGTEIFCIDDEFTYTMVYDTESDSWQELQGWPNPNPESLHIDSLPILFVVENQLHILLICDSDSQEGYIHLVYVYDRSTDAWRELNANMPNREYFAPGSFSPVARMYLPYLKGT